MSKNKQPSKFSRFMYKYVSGAQRIKIGSKILSYPKTAYFMMPAIVLMAFFQDSAKDIPELFYLGVFLFVVGIISLFYPKIDPISKKELNEINNDSSGEAK